MRVYESDLIHFGLNLTSIMKKSFYKKGEDIFKLEQLDLKLLNVYGSSIATLNILYFKEILLYIDTIQKQLEVQFNRDITYLEIRNELRKRKAGNILKLKEGESTWNHC